MGDEGAPESVGAFCWTRLIQICFVDFSANVSLKGEDSAFLQAKDCLRNIFNKHFGVNISTESGLNQRYCNVK